MEQVKVELPKDVVIEFRDRCHADPGNHPWKSIYGIWGGNRGDVIIRWCPICGSVVVDIDYDGRVQPGAIMSIESPQIANKMSWDGKGA